MMTSITQDLGELQELADRIVALVEELSAGTGRHVEANVRVGRNRHGLTRFANSFIHQHVGEDTREATLTVAVDGRVTTASSTDLGEAALRRLVGEAIESASLQPVDPHWPGATPPADGTGLDLFDDDTAAASPDRRATGVQRFLEQAADLRGAGYLDTAADWVAFASTAGQRIAGRSTRATVDGIHQTQTSAGSAHQTSRRLRDLDGAAAGALAADRARRSAEFVDIDPGAYEVVLNPEAVATIVTFLAVYGFNAKQHLEGMSFVQLGEQQVASDLTLRQDPTDPRALGLPFDVEGTPRQPYTLIDRGVSANLSHDRRTAKRAEAVSTGDAIPGGASFGPVPTNLVLEAGDRTQQELVAEVERGLLITTFNYCRVLDPKSLVVTGLTRNGTFLIERGEVTGAVGNLRFTQPFLEAVGEGRVLGIGNDDRYADGEFGPGIVICPSLHLASWSFTGGARG